MLLVLCLSFFLLLTTHSKVMAMPVPCDAPSAPSYPEYYTTCQQGGGTSTVPIVQHNVFYDANRNEYVLTYSNNGYQGMNVTFDSSAGTHVVRNYGFPDVTGIYYITCNGMYNFDFINSSSSVIASITNIPTSQIVNPTCNSYSGNTPVNQLSATNGTDNQIHYIPNGADTYDLTKDGVFQQTYPTGTSSVPTNGPGLYTIRAVTGGVTSGLSDVLVPPPPQTTQQCSDQICQCIHDLQPALNQIQQNTGDILTKINNELLPTLNTINQTLTDQLQVSTDTKQILTNILGQLTPDQVYPIKKTADYAPITLDNNKPLMRDTVYTDNTTYFQDQGDASPPPPFPVAPEPSDNWKDANGNIVAKAPVITAKPVSTRSPVIQKQTSIQRTIPLQPQITIYPLHWQSNQYIP